MDPLTDGARLAELVSLASAKEAIKDYDCAADLYSQAVELQANLNGEMAVGNADLLYSYGKCLYHIAVSKSDVLGSKVPARDAVELRSSSEREPLKSSRQPKNPERTMTDSEQSKGSVGPVYFQFNGDENFEDDDEDEDDRANEDEERDIEEDDFENAFEMLDMARVLLLRRLENTPNETNPASAEIRKVRERLSDIYDLQAEISLEGERFQDAVTDLRAALALKCELFPAEDPAIAECHYKLSLALEFSSITNDGDETNSTQSQNVDFQMREDAAKHMQNAIDCCNRRISLEEQKLALLNAADTEEVAKVKRCIDDVKEIVSDMEQRVCLFLIP